MSMDITPLVPAGRQLVQAYGDGGFRISGENYQGSVMVFLEQTLAWSGDATLDGLQSIISLEHKPEILILGCGPKFVLPPEALRTALRSHGTVLEWMDTAAACRTYNVLASEERSVVAALIAVD